MATRNSPSGPVSSLQLSVLKDIGTINSLAAVPVTFVFPGAKLTDGAVVNPPVALDDSIFIVQMHTNTDSVDAVFFNISGAPISPGPLTYIITVLKR